MKTVKGTPRFDSIFIGEVKLNLLAFPDVHVTATAGYMDSETGKTFGSTQFVSGWSQTTLNKLNDLLDEMEQDIASQVFKEGSPIRGGVAPASPTSDGVPQL
jgi:hypothetical protein